MNTLKMFTPLCGNELPEWTIGFDKLPQSFWTKDHSTTLGQSSWPVLRTDQCPQEWLIKDPGFFILLRDNDYTDPGKPWLVGSKDYEFKSPQPKKPLKKIVCIAHHDAESADQKFNKLVLENPAAEILWTQYACTVIPNLPLANYIDFTVLMQQMNFVPDAVYDLNFFNGDTFSPTHIFCFHQGAILMNTPLSSTSSKKIRAKKSLWYGEWIIYQPDL